jgi:hypothetical protein
VTHPDERKNFVILPEMITSSSRVLLITPKLLFAKSTLITMPLNLLKNTPFPKMIRILVGCDKEANSLPITDK